MSPVTSPNPSGLPTEASAPIVERFQGTAADGRSITAVYAAQPAANVAFALVFPGRRSDDDGGTDAADAAGASADLALPRIVHWGRPLTNPSTVVGLYDALKPQRVSGALDDTAWPFGLPAQAVLFEAVRV